MPPAITLTIEAFIYFLPLGHAFSRLLSGLRNELLLPHRFFIAYEAYSKCATNNDDKQCASYFHSHYHTTIRHRFLADDVSISLFNIFKRKPLASAKFATLIKYKKSRRLCAHYSAATMMISHSFGLTPLHAIIQGRWHAWPFWWRRT